MELDAGTELDATECLEVADAVLIGGTSLGNGRGRRMERGHDGRHKSGRWEGDVGGEDAGEWRRHSPSCERGTAWASGVRPIMAGVTYGWGRRRRAAQAESVRARASEVRPAITTKNLGLYDKLKMSW